MKKQTNKQPAARTYRWRDGYSYKGIDAESVGVEIERLLVEHNHQLDPADVVKAAEIPTSPLHSAFQWDDTEAARQWRVQQARMLLGAIQVTIITPKGGEVTTRLTVATEAKGGTRKRNYSSTEYALNDPELRAEVLKTALLELISFRRKYAELSELVMVFAAIDKVRRAA
jgi:hypothetical protein